jgi:uncharacterized delta-60 repeat protein/uncharacterized repeat protein (TIGR01451 family)
MLRPKFTPSAPERLEDRLTPAGALDTTFNTTGTQTIDFGGSDYANAVVVQPDGKIVAVGASGTTRPDFAVARLNPDGSPDTTFGGGDFAANSGKRNVYFGDNASAGSEYATAVALYPPDAGVNANKIVVAGYTNGIGGAPSTANDFGVARLNTDGSLDTSFGAGGKAVVAFSGDDRAYGVAVQPDGKVVVVGITSNGIPDVAAARLNVDGSLDTTFDPADSGRLQFSFGTNPAAATDYANAVAIDKNNNIVIAGYTNANTGTFGNDFAIARVKPDGSFDPNFGSGGKTVDGIQLTDERGNALAFQSDGRIVVAGTEGNNNDFGLVRFNTDGSPDFNFGGTSPGLVTVRFGPAGSSQSASGVAVEPDDKIIVSGYTNLMAGGTAQFAVARLNADGTPDTNFGTGGKQTVAFPAMFAIGDGVALQPDGRIVVAGSVGTDFGLARLENDRVSLSLTLDDQQTSIHVGQQLTYVLIVANGGPDDVVGTRVSTSASNAFTGATFTYTSVGGSGVTGNTASGTGLPDDRNVTIPAGQTVTYTITVTLPNSATGTASVFAGASVPPGEFDANITNNAAHDTDTIQPTADLSATVTDGLTVLQAGQTVTYTVKVSNAGPDDVTGATVAVVLPADLTNVTFTSTAAGGASGNTNGTGAPADTLNLPSLGSVTYLVTGKVGTAAPGTVEKFQATITPPDTTFDPNTNNNTATDTDTIGTPPPPPPRSTGRLLAVSGAASGTAALYTPNASGQYANPPTATTPAGLFGGFAGEVRAATGDFNGDGVEDTVLITGPGTKTVMAVISGKDGSVLVPPTDPFGDANFTFGGFVAAGDIDHDGRAEWVVTPELRGGPRVVIFHLLANGSFDITSPGQPSLVANFFGIGDPSFRDGDRPALGDVNGDGILDVFSIAAFNGGPRTALYNGADVLVARAAGRDPIKLVGDFFAAPSGQDEGRGGRSIAVGDVNGDGIADLIATGDNLLGTGNQVVVFSGADLIAGRFPGFGATPLANFTVSGQDPAALVSVVAVNADGDARADLAVGSGAGQESQVKVYLGKNLAGSAEPASTSLDPFGAALTDGVFVG